MPREVVADDTPEKKREPGVRRVGRGAQEDMLERCRVTPVSGDVKRLDAIAAILGRGILRVLAGTDHPPAPADLTAAVPPVSSVSADSQAPADCGGNSSVAFPSDESVHVLTPSPIGPGT